MSVSDYYEDDCKPKKCTKCDSTDLKSTVDDIVNGHICEETVICRTCGKELGFWAYGNWNPKYREEYEQQTNAQTGETIMDITRDMFR